MTLEHARILVVDDEPDESALLAGLFARAGHDVICADGAATALAALAAPPPPDLILLDLRMPTTDGLALLAQVREATRTAAVPVIVVSGHPDVAKRAETLAAGANDFLAKPVNGAELLARARNLLRTADELARLRRGSFLDPLTGLLNRVGLDHLLALQVEHALRHHGELAVLFVDLDGFKRINDGHGHVVGDHVLCAVAGAFAAQLRGSDLAARWGGDEFVVVLPGADAHMVEGVVRRLREAVAAIPLPAGATVGASIGVACLFSDVAPGADTARRLIAHADAAMYRLKQAHHAAG